MENEGGLQIRSQMSFNIEKNHCNDKGLESENPALAATSGNLHISELIYIGGENIDVNGHANTALLSVIKKAHAELAKYPLRFDCAILEGNPENEEDVILQIHDVFGETALHYAIRKGHLDIVDQLLETEVNVNTVSITGNTPLLEAIQRGYTDIAVRLIIKGADVIASRGRQGTPLNNACWKGNNKIIKELLKKGALIDEEDIFAAINKGHIDIAKYLMSKHDKVSTLLHIAIIKKYLNVAKILLDIGADVNFVDKLGETPLSLAIKGNHTIIIDCLLSKGADLSRRHTYYESYLHMAVMYKREEICAILLKNGADINAVSKDGNTPLLLAITYESHRNKHRSFTLQTRGSSNFTTSARLRGLNNTNKKIVECLISYGADLTIRNKRTQTALYLACLNKNLELVKKLLQYGAVIRAEDIFITIKNGNTKVAQYLFTKSINEIILCNKCGKHTTSLHIASSIGYFKFVNMSLQLGADVNSTDSYNSTPLILAIKNKNTHVADHLISIGSDITIPDNYGNTPLHIASMTVLVLVKILVEEGADVNAVNHCGDTPLVLAIKEGNSRTAKYLIENGADVTKRNKCMKTPLHFACEYKNVEIGNILIEEGADINAEDIDGNTPLSIAIANECHELGIELL